MCIYVYVYTIYTHICTCIYVSYTIWPQPVSAVSHSCHNKRTLRVCNIASTTGVSAVSQSSPAVRRGSQTHVA